MKRYDPERKDASRHDHGYKRLFSHPATVEELLRGFLRQDWVRRLDFSTLERVGNSFISDDLRERHSDVIWRLRFRSGEESWFYLYLLLEFQSASDPFMAVRLLSYTGLLLEEIIRREKLKPGDRLPAVLPMVLHNGKRPWRAPRSLASLFVHVPPGLREYLPRLRYVLLDESRLDLDAPELARNRVAALFRIEDCETQSDLLSQLQRLSDLLPADEDPEIQRTLLVWLTSVLRRSFPGVIISQEIDFGGTPMLEENMRIWREKLQRDTFREGRREGRLEGTRKVLLQQMTLRFGPLPAAVRQKVEAISSAQTLSRLARKVITSESLQDLGLH